VCGGEPVKANSVGYVAGVRDDLIKQIGISFLAEMKSESAGGRVLIDALALSLTARLAQRYSTGAVSKAAALRVPHGLDDARLQRVLDYIREHLGDDVGVEELAAVACLSPFHFTRMFRNSMGMPPHRYMAELRLERAKSLLIRSNESLVEIALATCFSSQSNFTRAFRQATGLTPGAFRRTSR
jgi:AraC family transcriptional regulator